MIKKFTKSFSKEQTKPSWYLIDLRNQVLGRAASQIAQILRGKHKPTYTPHADTGDFIVAINAKHIRVTGNKASQKKYYRHSGFIGGIKERDYATVLAKDPGFIIYEAVKGMLPKTHLAKHLITKLKVYPDEAHPHQAQSLQMFTLGA
ncbi:MAG: 50S ribosomal protein L13 [Deltaproteobacteria bacterium]|nr:50S ribosomal protein L13 [Deltaproteobacteria bacterium]